MAPTVKTGPTGPTGRRGRPERPAHQAKALWRASFDPGEGGCAEGGTSLEVDGSGTEESVCNGEEGSPWTAGGTLPVGETETGTYAGSFSEGQFAFMPLTFNLPIDPAPEAICRSKTPSTPQTGCPGIVAGIPQADPGKLCVYKGASFGDAEGEPGEFGGVVFLKPDNALGEPGVATSGTVMTFICASGAACSWYGVWAASARIASVTGEGQRGGRADARPPLLLGTCLFKTREFLIMQARALS